MRTALTLLLLHASLLAAGETTPPVRVVFAGQTQGGTWDLWLASEDGAYLKRMLETPDVDERTPVISPDRKLVAYSTSRGDLLLYDIHRRTQRRLSLPAGGRAEWPAWGLDPRIVYYVEVQMGQGPDEGRIWSYDIESGKTVKVADEPEVEGWPAVSDTGVLLFTTWTQSQASHLSTMTPGDAASKLLWDKSLSLSGAAHLPGGRVAAIAADQAGQKVIIFSRGQKVRELDVSGASGRPVAYQNGLLLTRVSDGAAGIHVLDLSTGKTRAWTNRAPKELVQMRDPDYR